MTDLFTRALARLSRPELRALWQAELDGRLDGTLEPRDRLAAWHRRQKRQAFLAWARTLSVIDLQRVNSRLLAGEDPDEIRRDYPNNQPAPTGAGHPTAGQYEPNSRAG